MKSKLITLLIVPLFLLAIGSCGEKKEAKTEGSQQSAQVEEKAEAQAPQPALEQKPAEEQPAVASEEKGTEPSAAEVTIVGTVDSSGKLTSEDGQGYAIADNDMGRELRQMVHKKVEVRGAVLEQEGSRTITVTEYKQLE